MAEIAGKTNLVYILTGSSAMTDSTGAQVLGCDDSSYKTMCDLLEITAFGDTNKMRLAGLLDTSIDLSGNYYPGDTTGQDELVPGDSVYVGIYPSGSSSAGYQFPGIVESFEIKAAVGDKQTFSATVQGNGAVVALPAQA
jgi:hypothetical protein